MKDVNNWQHSKQERERERDLPAMVPLFLLLCCLLSPFLARATCSKLYNSKCSHERKGEEKERERERLSGKERIIVGLVVRYQSWPPKSHAHSFTLDLTIGLLYRHVIIESVIYIKRTFSELNFFLTTTTATRDVLLWVTEKRKMTKSIFLPTLWLLRTLMSSWTLLNKVYVIFLTVI